VPTPARLLALLAAVAVVAAGLTACGRSEPRSVQAPVLGQKGDEVKAAPALGFPLFATKNTTRVGGADPVADAAAVARAVYPGTSPMSRPRAVTLVDAADWRAAVAASVLMADPIRAPILLGDGEDLPGATSAALEALAPAGAEKAGGAQVIRVGDVARPKGLKSTDLVGRDDFALARAIDAFQASARGASADSVVVASADRPEYAMPAAAWAAKSGDPVLFVQRDSVPADTRAAIEAHEQPHIYVLGPASVISSDVVRSLRSLGTVVRIDGRDPQRNAIEFARYTDGTFGWGVVDPGHGLVFANPDRAADAAAAAPLSASGKWGPLLLLDPDGELPASVSDYLLDIQPGYGKDPTRGVYNHGWLIGDDKAVSSSTQARIDQLLEIVQASNRLPSREP
jgi:hypothetical protein